MKLRFLLALTLVVLLGVSPGVSFAAYNDVTLVGGDTLLTVGGVSFTAAAPDAVLQSISVSGDTITVTMPANSYLKLTSSARHTLTTTSRSSVTKDSTCTDSLATDVFSTPASVSGDISFNITVDSGTCTTGGTPGGGGSGGGGGGGYTYVPPVSTPVATVTTAPAATVTNTTARTAIAGTVDRLLTKGMTNPGVKTLQQILNSDPDTRIANFGSGSPGNESDFFGSATLKAVQKFQVKYGIAKPGDSGYGNVGPLTRTILNSLMK